MVIHVIWSLGFGCRDLNLSPTTFLTTDLPPDPNAITHHLLGPYILHPVRQFHSPELQSLNWGPASAR